jgi:hypothetical protein
MTATSINPFAKPSDPSPMIDAEEIHRAIVGLRGMIQEFGPDSVCGMVLTYALRELKSLQPSAVGRVVGPYRMSAAA